MVIYFKIKIILRVNMQAYHPVTVLLDKKFLIPETLKISPFRRILHFPYLL